MISNACPKWSKQRKRRCGLTMNIRLTHDGPDGLKVEEWKCSYNHQTLRVVDGGTWE